MKRRSFFWKAAAGIGGVLSLGTVVYSSVSLERAVEKRILDELSFLKLDPEGVRQFVVDYTERLTPNKKLALEYYSLAGIPSRYSRKIHRLMNDFLLSTDFFRNNMDESKTVHYVALNDPHARPCVNPFSHIYYPDEAGRT